MKKKQGDTTATPILEKRTEMADFGPMCQKMAPKPAKQFVSAKLARTLIVLAFLGVGVFYLISFFQSYSWFSSDGSESKPTVSTQAKPRPSQPDPKVLAVKQFTLRPREVKSTGLVSIEGVYYTIRCGNPQLVAFSSTDSSGTDLGAITSRDKWSIQNGVGTFEGMRGTVGTQWVMIENKSDRSAVVTVTQHYP